jgi:hypothetical protein
MKKILLVATAAIALVFAASAAAALEPGVYDPGNTHCVTATYDHGVLQLAKNCATSTNASAGAGITGLTGQTFQTASFTLKSASQCQGGSPRFNVYTTGGTFFLGCNNVTPTINPDGTATYTFTATDLQPAVAGTTPGTITSDGVEIVLDVQGVADLSKIVVNGHLETPVAPTVKCKKGGWKALHFRNQGKCVSHYAHAKHHDEHHLEHGHR